MANDPDPRPADAAEALERLGRLALRGLPMAGLLQTVADLTKTVIPTASDVSVALLVKDRPTTMVTTGQLADDLDERQYDRGHGPCLHAARTGEMVEIADARSETRWPDYLPRAIEQDCLSSLSVPLHIDEDDRVTAALNIYARAAHAFDDDSRAMARRFAPYASIAAGNVHALRSAQDKAENLQRALESRAVIDQAKGVLIERYKLTPDQAFQLLARASMNLNRKLVDVAEHLLHTGELLGAAPATDSGTPATGSGHRPEGPRRP